MRINKQNFGKILLKLINFLKISENYLKFLENNRMFSKNMKAFEENINFRKSSFFLKYLSLELLE